MQYDINYLYIYFKYLVVLISINLNINCHVKLSIQHWRKEHWLLIGNRNIPRKTALKVTPQSVTDIFSR